MVEGRVRTRPPSGPLMVKGSWWWAFDGLTREDLAEIGDFTRTEDTVGNFGEDNYFLSVNTQRFPALMSGTQFASDGITVLRELYGYPAGYFQVGYNPNELSHVVDPNWADLTRQAISAMNPNRPHLNMPGFLGELKDLPEMLREIPEALRGLSFRKGTSPMIQLRPGFTLDPAASYKKAAHAYLAWSFGWAPLLRDLNTMLDFGTAIQRRLEWVKALAEGKSVYRSLKLPDWKRQSFAPPFWAETWAASLQLDYYDSQTVESWCTSRWRAKFPTFNLLGDDKRHLQRARALAAGVTSGSSAEAVWQLLPWSWLIDWFVDIGQLLAELNNSLFLELESLCYMRKVTLVREYRIVSKSSWVNVSSPGRCVKVRKERFPLLGYYTPLTPSLRLPIFTKGQISILFSLIASKEAIKKGSRASVVWR